MWFQAVNGPPTMNKGASVSTDVILFATAKRIFSSAFSYIVNTLSAKSSVQCPPYQTWLQRKLFDYFTSVSFVSWTATCRVYKISVAQAILSHSWDRNFWSVIERSAIYHTAHNIEELLQIKSNLFSCSLLVYSFILRLLNHFSSIAFYVE